MPTKKKTNTKLTKTQLLIAIVLLLIGAILVFLIAKVSIEKQQKNQILHEQKARLDAAGKDINHIAERLLANYSSDEVVVKKSSKDCHESSAKYSRGTTRCGTGYFAKIYSQKTQEQLQATEVALNDLVRETPVFTSKSAPKLDQSHIPGRLSSFYTSYQEEEKVECYFYVNTYTPEQYGMVEAGNNSNGKNVLTISIGCNEITKEPIYPLVD